MPHECTNCGRAFPDGSKEMLSGCPDCGGNKFRYRPSGGKLDADGSNDPSEGDAGRRSGPGTGGEPGDPPGGPESSRVADTVSKATRNLREWVGVEDERAPPTAGSDELRESGPPGDSAETSDSSWPADDAEPDATTSDPGQRPDHAEPPVGTPTEESLEEQFDPSPAEDAVVEEGSDGPSGEDGAQARARTSMVGPDDIPEDAGEEADDGGTGGSTGADPAAGATNSLEDGPDLSELREELNDQFESIKIVEPGQYELNLMELYDRDEYIISLMEDGRYAIEVPETWRDAGN